MAKLVRTAFQNRRKVVYQPAFHKLSPYIEIVHSGWTLRQAIKNRKKGHIDVDTGSRMGWVQRRIDYPMVLVDTDGELVCLFLPSAIKPRGRVCRLDQGHRMNVDYYLAIRTSSHRC